MTTLLERFSDANAEIVAQTRRSLVQIVGHQGNLGAGTIWHPDGLILTNAHVVSHGPVEVVLPDSTLHSTQIVAIDHDEDLAALAINAKNLPTIELGDSREVRAGQWVMALGHPWGVVDAVTSGAVIGIGANLPEMRGGREWIALDLHLRPGHSGGPLINVKGQLIGINTMISGPQVGFAVPVHVVKAFLKRTIGLYVARPEQVEEKAVQPEPAL